MIDFGQKIGAGREIHSLSPAPFSDRKPGLTDSVGPYFVQAKRNLPSYESASVVDSQKKWPFERGNLFGFKTVRVKANVPDPDYAGRWRTKCACIIRWQLKISSCRRAWM